MENRSFDAVEVSAEHVSCIATIISTRGKIKLFPFSWVGKTKIYGQPSFIRPISLRQQKKGVEGVWFEFDITGREHGGKLVASGLFIVAFKVLEGGQLCATPVPKRLLAKC